MEDFALDNHWLIQVATSSLLADLGNYTNRMALAAGEIGKRYRDADALAHARVGGGSRVSRWRCS
jgi:hypothetical protein